MVLRAFYRAFVLLVILFFLAKPFFLGFYHDDWSTLVGASFHGGPFSLDRLTYCLDVLLSRPLSGLILYLVSSIAGTSSLLWQGFTSLLVFIGVGILYKFLTKLSSILRFTFDKSEILAFSSLLFILPWLSGATFFVISAMCALSALILFLLSGLSLLIYLTSNKKKHLVFTGLFYLVSILTYEAFYFQFVTLTLLGAVLVFKTPGRRPQLLALFGVLLVAQILGLGWNRLTYALDPLSKSFYDGFSPLFLYTLKVLPERILRSYSMAPLFLPLALGGLILYAPVVFGALWQKSKTETITLFSLVVVCLIGILSSVFLYALAGYGVDSLGLTSRTTLVLSFYFILGLFLIAGGATLIKSEVRYFYTIALCLFMLLTFSGNLWKFREWRLSWQIQSSVINAFPIAEFKKAPKDATIIYHGPYEYAGVTIFQSSWDLTNAINYSHPPLKLSLLPAPPVWQTRWDGKVLAQFAKDNGSTLWKSKTKNVWLWDYPTKKLTKLSKRYVE